MAADQLLVFNASACSKRRRASGSRPPRCNSTPQPSRKMEYQLPSRRFCGTGTGSRKKRRNNFRLIFVQADGRCERGWLTGSIFCCQASSQNFSPALAAGEKFWDEAWQQKMEPVSQPRSQRPSAWTKISRKLFRRFFLEPVPVPQNRLLGSWYSIFLDGWGVELQRGGRLPEARRRFEQALALNTNNWSAAISLQCNTNLQAGNKLSLAGLDETVGRFKNMQELALVMNSYGPFDDPVLCFLLGRAFQQAGWPRQTMQQLERAKTLAPGALPPELALAELYSRYRMGDKVFEIVKRVRATAAAWPTNQVGEVDLELSLLEASAWMSQT